MIILRQKRYSNPVVRKGIRTVGDAVVNARDKIYRSLGVGNPIVNEQIRERGRQGVRKLSGKIAKLVPGNLDQAKIMTQANKVKALEAAVKAEEYTITHTPGQAVGSAVGEIVKRPLFVGGAVGGYVPLVTKGIMIPGTTAGAAAGDEAVRRLIPVYDRVTKKLIGWYNTGWKNFVPRNFVEKTVNLAYTIPT